MENNYYLKYLKYKSKYLELQKQLGGYKCSNFGKPRCNITPGCTWSGKTCEQKHCKDRSIGDCTVTAGCENIFRYNFEGKHSWEKVPPTHTCERQICKGRDKIDCIVTAGCEFVNGQCK